MFKISLKNFSFRTLIVGLLFAYLGIVYFSIAISNIVLGVAVFTFILGVSKKIINLNLKGQNWYLYVYIIVPFLLTLVSVLNSDNVRKGLDFLWLRFPILIIPFVLVFMEVKNKDFLRGLKIFAIFTVIASIKTIYNAIRYINEDVLFETDFTFFITIIQHPYFGIFVLIIIISIIEFEMIKNKMFKIGICVLLILAISLTTSRLVYLLSFLIISFYLFKFFSRKKALFFGILLGIFTLSFILVNKSVTTKYLRSVQYENSPRLKLWNNAYKVITSSSDNLFAGIGIGDYYQDKKDPYFFKESDRGTLGYNPHSQLVEFFVTNGLFGVLIFISIIIVGIKNIRKQNRYSILVFGIIIMFSLTESILSRQYGVQLYSIFIPLVFRENFKRKK